MGVLLRYLWWAIIL
uniref:Uncharacterized protein n=1 Tax=Rhizophora mucronata TaxID=61149 RepID=A0A2P2N0I6_RHIMU